MFEWITLRAAVVTVVCVAIVIGLIALLGSADLTEEDMCSGYKYSKMQDVPAYCLKYFQE